MVLDAGDGVDDADLAVDAGAGPDLDLRLLSRDAADGGLPRAGMPLEFRLLDHGRPLAGQALELRSELSPLGLWARTDADGRVRLVAPLPGRWLLRGVELRPADDGSGAWASRFVTLAFTVRAREPAVAAPLQNGKTLKSNTRSASQPAASTAIASEPPMNTVWR